MKWKAFLLVSVFAVIFFDVRWIMLTVAHP